jgi:arylsulfatase A-like enzyme
MNTIVLAARGLPAGFLGPYGNEWVATPNLDRLAADAVVFDNHYADAPELAAACRTWRTGRRGITGGDFDLVRHLNRYGVRTVLVRHARPGNDLPADFVADWSRVIDAPPSPADRSPIDALVRALQTLAAELGATTPWLVWVDIDRFVPPWDAPSDVFEAYIEGLFDDDGPLDPEADPSGASELPPQADAVVEPWLDPPTGWFDGDDVASRELLYRTFAAAVTTFDADFGRLWKAVESLGWLDAANVVLTADRGTPLGEHGVIGLHRPWMHEELIHLPLIVRLAGAEHAGRRVAALTQTPDLTPTLLDWAGVPLPDGIDGTSLAAACRGEALPPRIAFGGLELDGRRESYLRTADWHLIALAEAPAEDDDDPRGVQLYAKPDDRWEQNDVSAAHADLGDELGAQLRAASR